MFNIFKIFTRDNKDEKRETISSNSESGLEAAAAVAKLLAREGPIETSFDILRNQLFHRVLSDMLDGDKTSAITVLYLWAHVADRAMSVATVAKLTNLSEESTASSLDVLFSYGIVECGQDCDGENYYRLSHRGMNMGLYYAIECLKIVKALPLND